MLFRWCRQDLKRGIASTHPLRWFQWGYNWAGDLDRYGLEQPRYWYILIRLPFYFMAPRIYLDEAPPVWHQRCLLFKEPIPAGAGGWKEIELECDR